MFEGPRNPCSAGCFSRSPRPVAGDAAPRRSLWHPSAMRLPKGRVRRPRKRHGHATVVQAPGHAAARPLVALVGVRASDSAARSSLRTSTPPDDSASGRRRARPAPGRRHGGGARAAARGPARRGGRTRRLGRAPAGIGEPHRGGAARLRRQKPHPAGRDISQDHQPGSSRRPPRRASLRCTARPSAPSACRGDCSPRSIARRPRSPACRAPTMASTPSAAARGRCS